MNRNVHIVQKQRYEIKTSKQKTAMDIQNRLGELNTRYVLPGLAERLDKYFSTGEVVTIDKLELELGKINTNAGDDEWMQMIFEHLDGQLKQTTSGKKEKKQRHQHLAESWIWFLKNGMLSANSIYNSVKDIKKELMMLDEGENQLIRDFLFHEADDIIIKRFVSNASLEIKASHLQFIFSVADIGWLNSRIQEFAFELNKKISSSTTSASYYNQILWKNVFKCMALNKNITIPVQSLFEQIKESVKKVSRIKKSHSSREDSVRENLPGQEIQKVHSENITEESLPEKEIFISNAGLCLLTPWLTSFFKETGLIIENAFADKLKQQHSIYLLHYLVTKETDPTEELLVFPKLLCGWPLQMPVINSYQVTEQEKIECEDLLKSIIQNWPVLKNTSTDGLRESFLQRPGKLNEEENKFVLQPEQQSIDLLLEYIPWTFRYIRLPWMKKAIQIDWY
jgi:hypothetical protein